MTGKSSIFILAILMILAGCFATDAIAGDGFTIREERYARLTVNNTIGDLLKHPAFGGFAPHLLPRERDVANTNLTLRNVGSLMPYHGYVDSDTVVTALNRMIEDAENGNKIFCDFYSKQEKQRDASKESTGIFFFRGKPGAPFAVICPGGGFSYVGSFHEGFSYALEISKKGYNAFVLQYRVGNGGLPATQDLAAALSYIFEHAETLGVATNAYSLWGSSAGARMAANVGSEGSAAFGGSDLPKPATVVMAYTGHAAFKKTDPPTFALVSENDRIASASVMERRIDSMKQIGIDAELHKYKNAGHGFGLGVGTDAEGWIEKAIRFWAKYVP